MARYKVEVKVGRNGVEVKTNKGEVSKWEYPAGVVSNLEILDKDKFQAEWSKWWQSGKMHKQKSMIVISDDIVFRKEFAKKALDKEDIQSFLEEIPFDNKKISYKIITTGEKSKILGTNKEIYESLEKGIWAGKGQVLGVEVEGMGEESNFLSAGKKKVKVPWIWILAGLVWVGIIAFFFLTRG